MKVGKLKQLLEGVDDDLSVIIDAKRNNKFLVVGVENYFYNKKRDKVKLHLRYSADRIIDRDDNYIYPDDYEVGREVLSLKDEKYTVRKGFIIRR